MKKLLFALIGVGLFLTSCAPKEVYIPSKTDTPTEETSRPKPEGSETNPEKPTPGTDIKPSDSTGEKPAPSNPTIEPTESTESTEDTGNITYTELPWV